MMLVHVHMIEQSGVGPDHNIMVLQPDTEPSGVARLPAGRIRSSPGRGAVLSGLRSLQRGIQPAGHDQCGDSCSCCRHGSGVASAGAAGQSVSASSGCSSSTRCAEADHLIHAVARRCLVYLYLQQHRWRLSDLDWVVLLRLRCLFPSFPFSGWAMIVASMQLITTRFALKRSAGWSMICARNIAHVGAGIWRLQSRHTSRSLESSRTSGTKPMSTFAKRMRMSNGPNALPSAPSGADDHDLRMDDGIHRTGATFAVPGAAPLAVRCSFASVRPHAERIR